MSRFARRAVDDTGMTLVLEEVRTVPLVVAAAERLHGGVGRLYRGASALDDSLLLARELGRYVDHQLLGRGRFASEDRADVRLTAWRRAVRLTPAQPSYREAFAHSYAQWLLLRTDIVTPEPAAALEHEVAVALDGLLG